MIMEHAYGELLEACLAINLAYLALERFRYRDAIRKLLRMAMSHLEGMPEPYRGDKAWSDVTTMTKEEGPGPKASRILKFVYKRIFNTSIDRALAMVAASAAFLLLVLRAMNTSVPVITMIEIRIGAWGEWSFLFFMVATTILIAILIRMGQGCVHYVATNVIENIAHLAEHYKVHNQAAADAMLKFVQDVRSENHGI